MSSISAEPSEPVQTELKADQYMPRLQELEERLQRVTEERDGAYREIDDLARFISHDLRAPLRGIDGYSKALMEDYTTVLDATGKAYLQFISEASRQAASLIEKLIIFIRTQRAEMHTQTIDLSLLAAELCQRLQDTQPERAVTWMITPDIFVVGDYGMIQVLLRNLLENAWKFTGKHEHARIEIGKIQTDTGSVFFVRDDGAGFNMAYQAKLFQPFQRLHSGHEFEGVGMGLAIAGRVIERHHGRIWAEGNVEQGATFYFTLEG